MPPIQSNVWNCQGITGVFYEHKVTGLPQGEKIILLIILLQSRRFSQGKIIGNDACFGGCTNMEKNNKHGNCGAISHVEVPLELLWTPGTGEKAGA